MKLTYAVQTLTAEKRRILDRLREIDRSLDRAIGSAEIGAVVSEASRQLRQVNVSIAALMEIERSMASRNHAGGSHGS